MAIRELLTNEDCSKYCQYRHCSLSWSDTVGLALQQAVLCVEQ